MFLLLTEVTGTPMATLKSAPEDSAALRSAYPRQIAPGYHMSKRHWITLTPVGGPATAPSCEDAPSHEGAPSRADAPARGAAALDAQLVADLVTESYLLVLERSVPRRDWPVDPATFGQG